MQTVRLILRFLPVLEALLLVLNSLIKVRVELHVLYAHRYGEFMTKLGFLHNTMPINHGLNLDVHWSIQHAMKDVTYV